MTKSRWPRIKHYKRRLGALERRSFKLERQKQFLRTPWGDGLALFHNPFEIDAVLRQFEELGLTDLLDPPPDIEPQGAEYREILENLFSQKSWSNYAEKMADGMARICAAVGADAASIETFDEDVPAAWHEFGKQEAEAWFLTNFALFYSRQNASHADIEERLRWAHALGRLLEWRRWRREGHDLGAVQQARFSSGRDKKEGSKAVRQSKDRRRREIAEIVGKLGDAPRFKTGKKAGEVNFSEWAREVLKEARIDSALAHKDGDHGKAGILNEIAGQTEKTVISAIKFAIQCGEIGKTK